MGILIVVDQTLPVIARHLIIFDNSQPLSESNSAFNAIMGGYRPEI